jgi:TolB-like protein/Flp pilus assembly protein TadD
VHSELENIEKGIPTTERVVPKGKPITTKEITVTFRLKKLFIPALIVVAIAVVGIVIWQLFPQREPAPITPDIPSIAVLPLVDLSPQKDQGYFCDGMTEAIIEKLSQLRGLKVSSRTSVMRYKNTDKDLAEISKELSVATILEGSVQREEDNIRIHAQLVNVEDNFHIWSDHYDRKLTSVFAIQSDIAQQIARVLKARLTPEEEEKLARKPTENLTAYDYYLKGREYYNRYRKLDNENAIELYKKALELDPDFALAYSGLGDSYGQRTNRFGFPPEWVDESIKASEKAISLDPNLSEGYKALGLAYYVKGWWQECLKANQKAIELNPNNEQAVGNLGTVYSHLGQFDKALPWFKKELALDPTFPYSYAMIGGVYLSLDDYAKAEQWLNKALELQSDFSTANNRLIYCYLAQGKYKQALEHSQRWLSLAPNFQSAFDRAGLAELFSGNYEQAKQYFQKSIEIRSTRENLTYLGYIYWKKGQRDEARKLLNQSLILCQKELEQGNEHEMIPYYIAAINAIQGNKEEAYKWLKNQSMLGGGPFD